MAKKMTPEQQAEFDNATALLAKMTSIGEVARFIAKSWPKVWFGALPYLQAMASGQTLDKDEPYIAEDQRSMVVYFLANAATWKGPTAQATKKFLNDRYGYGKR